MTSFFEKQIGKNFILKLLNLKVIYSLCNSREMPIFNIPLLLGSKIILLYGRIVMKLAQ